MKVTRTDIDGLLILEPEVFGDERGFFMESFNQKAFDAAVGRHVEFVQAGPPQVSLTPAGGPSPDEDPASADLSSPDGGVLDFIVGDQEPHQRAPVRAAR